jgi:hypothetical protein
VHPSGSYGNAENSTTRKADIGPPSPVCRATGTRSKAYCGSAQHGPNGGAADSLDEAKAAFRAAWRRPLSHSRSGRDMLSLTLSAHDPLRT